MELLFRVVVLVLTLLGAAFVPERRLDSVFTVFALVFDRHLLLLRVVDKQVGGDNVFFRLAPAVTALVVRSAEEGVVVKEGARLAEGLLPVQHQGVVGEGCPWRTRGPLFLWSKSGTHSAYPSGEGCAGTRCLVHVRRMIAAVYQAPGLSAVQHVRRTPAHTILP